MASRLATWAFYAFVFFWLGVWAGGSSQGVRGAMRHTGEAFVAGYHELRQWAAGTIASPPRPAAAPADPLRTARAAYERGETSEAVALYRARLHVAPDDLDARGELGNVLTSAGRLAEASEVYYDLALRLARVGQGAQAQALEAAIRRHDVALADRLAAELKTAKAGG